MVERETKLKEIFSIAQFLKNFEKGVLILQPLSSRKRIVPAAAEKSLRFAKAVYPAFPRVFVIPQIHKLLDFR